MNIVEQAGNGPNRRHIEGSKIAKRLQCAKVLMNWGPFVEIVFYQKKVSQCQKTEKVSILSHAPYCTLRGKKEKPFWFCSLGQMV